MDTAIKILTVCVLCGFSSGCLTIAERMSMDDLGGYQVDCSQKAAQINFLRTQLPSPTERLVAMISIGGMFGAMREMYVGTYETKQAIVSRNYDSAVRQLIHEVKYQCP